jgi:hypothetical protein
VLAVIPLVKRFYLVNIPTVKLETKLRSMLRIRTIRGTTEMIAAAAKISKWVVACV